MPKLKVGVVGTGYVAQKHHMPAFVSHPKTELHSVCDPNKENLNSAANKFDIGNKYTDIKEMIGDVELDIVDICSPPSYHFNHSLLCLESGIHTIIEKPLGCSSEDADMLKKTSDSNDVNLSVIHNQKFRPSVKKAINNVKRGKIGDVIRFEYTDFKYVDKKSGSRLTSMPDHWVHNLPGGTWQETLPHAIYTLYQFVDDIEIESVHACKHGNDYPWLVADQVTVVLSHRTGQAVLQYSITESPKMYYKHRMVYGKEGEIDLEGRTSTVNQPKRYVCETSNLINSISQKLFSEKNMDSHAIQIHKFIDSLENDSEEPVSWDEVYVTNKIVYQISKEIKNQSVNE